MVKRMLALSTAALEFHGIYGQALSFAGRQARVLESGAAAVDACEVAIEVDS